VVELRARGMPLGLMPEMDYEEKEINISPGDELILYSDGLVEAHNPDGEMFGFPRLREMLANGDVEDGMIERLLQELSLFTGPAWEQEDDVTFVTLERLTHPSSTPVSFSASTEETSAEFKNLAHFEMASQPGNERQVMEQVASSVEHLNLPTVRLERLKTAVAEATMNAMEHGNQYRIDQPVEIEVLRSSEELIVRISDNGGLRDIPEKTLPDLEAKLDGLQSPRGWGLFLIKKMVDEMRVHTDEDRHTVELVLNLEGDIE
jgi:anti-sigma regulatory factor (Ser/Thr protein kinase)